MILVVDASVAVKWILREASTPLALALLRDPECAFAAPELIFLEVAGAFVRRANMDKSLQADALRALEHWTIAWSDHVVKNYRVTQRRLFHASSLAIQLGTPLKDCIYLALAIELKCDLITCDARFRDKARVLYAGVKLLEEVVLTV
jgi:predicted nucleic acid-binding protein